jgi:soluble lytic murein transglycosylase-like protein
LVLAQKRLSRACAAAFAKGYGAQAAPSGAAPFAATRGSASDRQRAHPRLAGNPDPILMELRTFLKRALLVAAVLVAVPMTADAQIYTWRDEAGNLVLSDKAKHPEAQTYQVTRAGMFRTTKPASRRAVQYDGLIEEHASANDVNPALVKAVIQAESAFNPRARSHKGAMGLMQLMPATAAELGVTDPYDPVENIRAGVIYLKKLLAKYAGNVALALAAYNAGPAAVARYGTVPPYRETRNYVDKVRKAADAAPAGPRTRVYRIVEVVNGREVVRYSDVPAPGAEVVKSAARR